jgi:hypothetical protein
MARPVLRRGASVLLGALLAAAAIGAGPAAASRDQPYTQGEAVEFSGTVTDAGGDPVEGVTVVVLASRRGFELKSMRHEEKGLVRMTAMTDAQGRFAIAWRWNPYYDTFRVRAEGVQRPTGADEGGPAAQPAVLAEIDITRRVAEGSPVVVALEVTDAQPHREDLALEVAPHSDEAPQSDDQRRVFEQMGKPDRVDRLEMSGGDEVAWWYFERGRSYHFRGGRLDQVIEFVPVQGF